jgi:hypothetical protein
VGGFNQAEFALTRQVRGNVEKSRAQDRGHETRVESDGAEDVWAAAYSSERYSRAIICRDTPRRRATSLRLNFSSSTIARIRPIRYNITACS